MLQLFRRKGPVAEQPLDALINSNKPPSEEQRRKIESILCTLKSEYHQVCGEPYVQTNPAPQSGRKYYDDIQRYQRALSPLRNFTAEILQAIFKSAVLSIEKRAPQTSLVGAIRLVSHLWNDAAIKCPLLWCKFPLMDLTTIPVTTNQGGAPIFPDWVLHHHLDRSGTMPISFTFHFWPGDETHNTDREHQMRETEAKKWVGILAQESHRWNEVEFQVTGSVARPLWDRLRVPGRVHHLSKFAYQRKGYDSRDHKTNRALEHLDFSTAPMLRHIMFDSLGLNQAARNLSIEGAKTHLLLPWAQLETFDCATQKDTMYPKVLELGENIRVLKYTSNKGDTLPMNPVFFQHLTKLSLCFGEDLRGDCLVEHLKYFSLPSLKELEVYWGSQFDQVDIYGSISSLIRRSGCALERLATEHKNLDYDYEGQIERFQEVLYRCPSLTHLDIAYLDAAKLEVLVPHENRARKPPLPSLRVLTLRSHRGHGSMDPIPLLKVVFGRTDSSRKPPNSHLEDVYVCHDDYDVWRNVLLQLGEQDGAQTLRTPFDPTFYSIALAWKIELMSASSQPNADISEQDLRPVLREMGSFDLQGRDARVLIVSSFIL